MHKSRGDLLAWQSGSFAILDIASHLWHKDLPTDPVPPVDERIPVLYTNNNGFFQQCLLPFPFIDHLYAYEENLCAKFQKEGLVLEQLARSNNALYPIPADNMNFVSELHSGDFSDPAKNAQLFKPSANPSIEIY